jgi:predicted MFS family arabinose efflux permease
VRTVFILAIAVFELGSLVCALAPTSKALIIGRAIAGMGVGGIFSGGLVIIALSREFLDMTQSPRTVSDHL